VIGRGGSVLKAAVEPLPYSTLEACSAPVSISIRGEGRPRLAATSRFARPPRPVAEPFAFPLGSCAWHVRARLSASRFVSRKRRCKFRPISCRDSRERG